MNLFASLDVWSHLYLLACLVIVVRLLTFRRGDSRHRYGLAWAAWLVIVVCAASAAKILVGMQPPPDPLQTLLTLAVAVLSLVYRGDLAHLCRAGASLCRWLRERVS